MLSEHLEKLLFCICVPQLDLCKNARGPFRLPDIPVTIPVPGVAQAAAVHAHWGSASAGVCRWHPPTLPNKDRVPALTAHRA